MTVTATDVLSVDEAAAVLHRHPETVRRLARTGQLPATKVGGTWVLSARRLDELVNGKTAERSPK